MPNKIKKIKTIIKNKKKLRGFIGQILYEENTASLIRKYKISTLPVVPLSELFSIFPGFDINKPVKILSDFANGSSPLNDYYFLCNLFKAIKAKNYFEIGTWVGLSARNIDHNSDEEINIFTLDIPNDHPDLKAYNIPKEIFGYHSKNSKRIKHLIGDSNSFDFSPYKNKMDLIFVDGNHSFDYVVNDTKKALELLKDNNSIIVWHDYLSAGAVNMDVLCGILEGIPEKEHKYLFHPNQTNTAVFSKSFGFKNFLTEKWKIPELLFEMELKAFDSGKLNGK